MKIIYSKFYATLVITSNTTLKICSLFME